MNFSAYGRFHSITPQRLSFKCVYEKEPLTLQFIWVQSDTTETDRPPLPEDDFLNKRYL